MVYTTTNQDAQKRMAGMRRLRTIAPRSRLKATTDSMANVTTRLIVGSLRRNGAHVNHETGECFAGLEKTGCIVAGWNQSASGYRLVFDNPQGQRRRLRRPQNGCMSTQFLFCSVPILLIVTNRTSTLNPKLVR